MGSPFKMTPGGPGKGTARTTGSGLAMRGLVNPSPAPTHMHEGKAHPKSESLSKNAPSATIKSRKVVNKPGSVTTSKTKSSSGKKTTAAYDAAVKSEGTKIVDPSKITPEMTAAANAKRAKARATDKANSASSSSSSKTVVTKPSRKVTESSETISKGESAYDIQRKAELANQNSTSRRAMNKEIAGNQSAKDSIKAADSYRKTQVKYQGQKAMSNPAVTTEAVLRGNAAGRKSARKSGYFTKQEQNTMFNPNYGQSTATAGPQGYKSKSDKNLTLKPGGTQRASSKYNSQIVPGSKEDVGGQVMKGSKKGTKTFSKKDANAGTRGSRG
jgi:hypothetical protein